MSIYNWISENIILLASDILLSRKIYNYSKLLQESQWWSYDHLREYQNLKLRKLIKYAYENVEYYHNIFEGRKITPNDVKTSDDLKKIPILTKEIIKRNFPSKIVSRNINKKDVYLMGSSGSTGEPLQYFVTKDAYSLNKAAYLRGWYWMGYRLGDKYVKLSQNPRDKLEKKLQDFISRNKYLYTQQLDNKHFKKIIEEIIKFNPKVIRCYPDPMMFLAQYVKERNIQTFKPEAINTTGNILHNEARNLIENQFNCKVFDSYTCEGSATIFECPTHTCYHLAMEYAISEILNDGQEVSEGERGRLITTDLTNYAVPFIRYDTQDIVVKGPVKCNCGRNLKTISKIEGRNSDILITPSGKFLIVHNFTGYFEWEKNVRQFQILQEELNRIIIKLVVNDKFNLRDEKRIIKYWKEYIDKDIDIQIIIVKEIPLTNSGKRRFIIRNPRIEISNFI